MRSTGLQGRLGNWAALLSPWTLEIVKCTRGEDEILGTIAASITPRENVDSILSSTAPRKQPRQLIPAAIPTVEPDKELAIVWRLPEWTVVAAESKYLPDLTVNETEYQGLLLGFDLLSSFDRGRLIICGDSHLVIRQMRDEIECKAPGMTPLRRRALDRLRTWPAHEFLHQEGTVVTSEADHDDLVVLNRLQELLLPKDEGSVARMVATTRSRTRSKNSAEVLQLDVVQQIRTDRILLAQNKEKWIVDLKAYLSGDLEWLDSSEARACGKIVCDYDVDDGGLLLYCLRAGRDDGDRDRLAKLVVPEDLQQDVLHHYHTILEGGHQGVGRTSQRVSSLVRPVQECATRVKDGADDRGELRGVRLLPVRGKRSHLEPGFMSDFFRAFNRIVGHKQRATMAYHPQANCTAERMVETLTRALKLYVANINQKDWDEYAERLTFALNTAYDRIRGETPFYLVHGWDARSTLEATLPLGITRHRDVEPRRWRFNVQRQYQQARKLANEALRDAIEGSVDQHNEDVSSHDIKAGDQVWLYLDRVKEGYARKLAHMWHAPFRVAETVDAAGLP
ncbi:hypothetical protein F444_23234 [Phytophthora nicotianae P1976]|uniref:Integrase catalytic domain-containing protein n=1 Tax=Phytophthora nicotianae P1976 TaxID=1317066 RepID=A0A080YVH8_PHYNI|nr:hypothetical protein F444_23234 [Phytophthora nicotianae P1976]